MKQEIGIAGLTFVSRLVQGIKVAQLHDLTNQALEEPLEDLRASIASLLDAFGVADARVDHDQKMVFVNGEAVRAKKQTFQIVESLMRTFAAFGLAEMRFTRQPSRLQVHALLRAFKETEATSDCEQTCLHLSQAMRNLGLAGFLEVRSIRQAQNKAVEKAVKVDDTLYVRLVYARTLALLREYYKRMRDEELRRYFWRKLVRAVQGVVTTASKNGRDLLSLTLVKNADEYVFNHAVNTCILSILLGQKAKLPKVQLVPLGLSALMHGIGKFRGGEDDGRSPHRALGAIVELNRMDDGPLACALVAYQHEAPDPGPLHPFSRVVAICESYDALTTPRQGKPALAPDRALNSLMSGTPRAYDGVLVGLFVNLLGLYPPGTTVLLDTKEVAVVVHPNPESPRRPTVAVLLDAQGRNVDGAILDLAWKGPDGHHPHRIARTFDPKALAIEIPEYLRVS